jgi:hypothetical protein
MKLRMLLFILCFSFFPLCICTAATSKTSATDTNDDTSSQSDLKTLRSMLNQIATMNVSEKFAEFKTMYDPTVSDSKTVVDPNNPSPVFYIKKDTPQALLAQFAIAFNLFLKALVIPDSPYSRDVSLDDLKEVNDYIDALQNKSPFFKSPKITLSKYLKNAVIQKLASKIEKQTKFQNAVLNASNISDLSNKMSAFRSIVPQLTLDINSPGRDHFFNNVKAMIPLATTVADQIKIRNFLIDLKNNVLWKKTLSFRDYLRTIQSNISTLNDTIKQGSQAVKPLTSKKDQPVAPVQPVTSAQSVPPIQPVIPVTPVTPVQPITPIQPGTSDQSIISKQPIISKKKTTVPVSLPSVPPTPTPKVPVLVQTGPTFEQILTKVKPNQSNIVKLHYLENALNVLKSDTPQDQKNNFLQMIEKLHEKRGDMRINTLTKFQDILNRIKDNPNFSPSNQSIGVVDSTAPTVSSVASLIRASRLLVSADKKSILPETTSLPQNVPGISLPSSENQKVSTPSSVNQGQQMKVQKWLEDINDAVNKMKDMNSQVTYIGALNELMKHEKDSKDKTKMGHKILDLVNDETSSFDILTFLRRLTEGYNKRRELSLDDLAKFGELLRKSSNHEQLKKYFSKDFPFNDYIKVYDAYHLIKIADNLKPVKDLNKRLQNKIKALKPVIALLPGLNLDVSGSVIRLIANRLEEIFVKRLYLEQAYNYASRNSIEEEAELKFEIKLLNNLKKLFDLVHPGQLHVFTDVQQKVITKEKNILDGAALLVQVNNTSPLDTVLDLCTKSLGKIDFSVAEQEKKLLLQILEWYFQPKVLTMDFNVLKKIQSLFDTLKGKKEGFSVEEYDQISIWAQNISDIIASGKSVIIRLLEAVAKENKIFIRAFDYFKQAYKRYIDKPEAAAVQKFFPALTNLYKNRKKLENKSELRDLFAKISSRKDILNTSAKIAIMDAWLDTM